MQAETSFELAKRIEDTFRQIEQVRMDGIPILNRALRVEVVGLRRHGDKWLCILVTPWFMNVLLLPLASLEGHRVAVGSKEIEAFPAGRFEMINGYEQGIGSHSMCSLFSPVLEFADHESAVLTAEAALAALFEVEAPEEQSSDADMEMIWRGELPDSVRINAAREDEAGGERHKADGLQDVGDERPALSRRGLLFGRDREEQA